MMWKPNAQVTVNGGTVAVDTNYVPPGFPCSSPVFGLHCGIRPPCGVAGIWMSNYTHVPIPFSGEAQWVQVITHTTIRFQDATNQWWRYEHASCLDNGMPSGSNPFDDSPGVGIDPATYGTQAISKSDSFETTLEFKPTSVSGTWVPLKLVSWGWSGAASAPSWSLSSPSNPNPTAGDATTYPFWTNLIANFPGDRTNYVREP
jgi:hypothetical protein